MQADAMFALVLLWSIAGRSNYAEATDNANCEKPQTAPDTFIWAVPRAGSTVLQQSLANSGYWGDNVQLEPLNVMAGAGAGVPHFLGKEFLSAQGMVDEVSSRGPFLWKEHATTLLYSWASPFRHPFLKTNNTKHIFLTRNPKQTVRSIATGTWNNKFHPKLNPNLTECFLNFSMDPESLQDWLDFAAGHKEQKMLYRYLNEVVKSENILFVDIVDVWADPEVALRAIATFLGVKYTDRFLNWDSVAFAIPPALEGWFDVVKGSSGWVKRTEESLKKVKGANTANSIGVLPHEYLKAMLQTTDSSLLAYEWMTEHVPAHQRLTHFGFASPFDA